MRMLSMRLPLSDDHGSMFDLLQRFLDKENIIELRPVASSVSRIQKLEDRMGRVENVVADLFQYAIARKSQNEPIPDAMIALLQPSFDDQSSWRALPRDHMFPEDRQLAVNPDFMIEELDDHEEEEDDDEKPNASDFEFLEGGEAGMERLFGSDGNDGTLE